MSLESVKNLKGILHKALPTVGSSHLCEAIARAFGSNTNAALRVFTTNKSGPQAVVNFDENAFIERLRSFEYGDDVITRARDVLQPQASLEAWHAQYAARPQTDVIERGLERSAMEQCRAYGIRLESDANSQWWAFHNVAGVCGPYRSELIAAEEAWAAWGGR
jgi:hypothetical protein